MKYTVDKFAIKIIFATEICGSKQMSTQPKTVSLQETVFTQDNETIRNLGFKESSNPQLLEKDTTKFTWQQQGVNSQTKEKTVEVTFLRSNKMLCLTIVLIKDKWRWTMDGW